METALNTQAQTYSVTSPVTNEILDTITLSNEQDIINAAARARAVQPAWATLPYKTRARILLNFHDRLLANPDAVMDTIQAETGKSRRDALTEVVVVAGTIRYYAYHGEAHLRPQRRRGAYPFITSGHLHYKPRGVVGIIAPWNFPFILTIAEVVPALLAGNAALIKPATLTPLSAIWGATELRAAGLPTDLLHIVPGSGHTAGNALIDHTDFIGFTGSVEVGRKVAARCGERLIPCSMELGGKNAMIVLGDADIDRATDNLLDGAFSNGGQVCIAIERVYVMDTIYDAFVTRLVEKTRAIRLGCTADYETDVGSLISPDQLEIVQSHVEEARAKGAQVLVGGEPRPDIGPLFYAPTVLESVTREMQVAKEETFGPVVSIYRVQSVDEAIEQANASDYGLNASIWTGDPSHSREIAKRIESGTVNINEVLMIYNDFDLPMGGVKDSGIGRRHGAYGIRKFTKMQSIAAKLRPLPWVGPVKLRVSAEQANKVFRFLRFWSKLPFLR